MPFVSQHTAIGLNTDDDQALMPPGDYRWLKNGRVGKSQEGNAGAIENILGMLDIDYLGPQLTARGWIYNNVLNEIYVLAYSSGSLNNAIFLIDGVTVTKIVDNANLNIPEDRLIWSIAIAGDELIWTTGEGEISQINIPKAKLGQYNSAGAEEMTLIRRGPKYAPIGDYETGGDGINQLGENSYQFAYAYVYENNQVSVLSPWSDYYYQQNNLATGFVADAYIEVSIPQGIANQSETIPDDIKEILWCVKVNNLTEWRIVERTEIFTAGSFTFGTVIKFYGNVLGETVSSADAYKVVESLPRNVVALEFMKNRLFIANYTSGYNQTQPTGFLGQAVAGTVELSTGNLTGFTYSSSYKLGLQFYDQYGRPGGVLRGETQSTPYLLEAPAGGSWYLYQIEWSINVNIEIPDWAYKYAVMITDNQSKSFYLHTEYIDAYFLHEDNDGTRTWGKDYEAKDWQYLMLDLTLLNINQMGYTYSKGDRVEFWLQGIRYDKGIEFVDGKFIAIRAFYLGPSFVLADQETGAMIIYSPVTADTESTYYETTEQFDVLNPGTGSRSYSQLSGRLTNGDTYFYRRDQGGAYATGGYNQSDPYANTFEYSVRNGYHNTNWFQSEYGTWIKNLGRVSVLYDDPGETQSTTTIKFSEEQLPDSTINNINQWNALDKYDRIGVERTPILKLTRARNVMIANHLRNTSSLYVKEGFVKTVDGGEFLAKSSGVITDDRELAGGFGCVPETVQQFEGRMWWVDPYQGHIARYTLNGTQSITEGPYKVERYFKNLATIFGDDNETLDNRWRVVPWAGYDPEFKEYFITFPKQSASDDPLTMVFSEETQRWIGEYEYVGEYTPDVYMRTNYKSYMVHWGTVYRLHDPNSAGYNYFIKQQRQRRINLIINPDAKSMKVWNNLWFTKLELVNGSVDPVAIITNKYGQLTYAYADDFVNYEGVWKAPIYFDRNTPYMTAEEAQLNGNRMRSEWIEIEIYGDLATLDAHVLTQVLWKQSEYTQ
jgi:hypothetical protein